MSDDKWVLMGTETIKNAHNRMMGVFLNEITGKIKRIELVGTAPYFYTHLDEQSLKNMPEVRQNFIKRNGNWKKNIIGFEKVQRKHPTTQEKIELTKVYGKSSWDLYNPRQGTGLADILPDKIVFNRNHKYPDYFLNEYGMIMGMSYRITDTGFSMVEEQPTDEIIKIVKDMNVPAFMKHALVESLLPLFFTRFPDLSGQLLAMDIEIDNDYKRAINPFEAKYPISSVSLYSKDFQIVYVLSDEVRDKNYDYELPENINILICNSEAEVIKNTLRDLTKRRKEKNIVTFNGDRFDFPYLMYRAHLLNIHEFDRDIWGRWDVQRQTVIKGIKGKFLIDLYPFFSNPSIKNYTFPNKYTRNSLDEITEGLLGVSKYKFEGMINQLCAKELAYYNYIDTLRTFELCTFEENVVINLFFMFMRLSGRTFEDVHRRKISAILTGLINTTLFNSNTLQPNKTILHELGTISSASIIKGKKFKGADVFDPHELKSIGFWTEKGNDEAVKCVDFASLYPSEIKQRNLCFSTVNCGHNECKENTMPNLPHYTCTQREGILSTMIGFIRDIRVKYFKKHKKDNNVFGIVEQTLKVLINAGYGVMGSEMFQYFTAPVAEGTTAWGRYDIGRVRKFCEDHKVKILGGDTDSIFLYKASKEFLIELFTWVNTELNLEMDVDYSGKFMLVHEKKNYIIDNEGKLIIKGLTGKKSNTPIYVQNCFTDVTTIIQKYNNDVDKMKNLITKIVIEYAKNLDTRKFDPILMKITIKLGKELHQYKVEGRQVKAAKKLVTYLKDKLDDKSIPDHIIVPKDTYIDFVIERLNRKREPTPIEMLEDNNGIDTDYYKERLVKTMAQVLKPLNIPLNQFLIDHRQQTLGDWF